MTVKIVFSCLVSFDANTGVLYEFFTLIITLTDVLTCKYCLLFMNGEHDKLFLTGNPGMSGAVAVADNRRRLSIIALPRAIHTLHPVINFSRREVIKTSVRLLLTG